MKTVTEELPIPVNEIDRLISLSDFDVDYSNQKDTFKDLTALAAKVAGVPISLINLIDTFTQWTISSEGLPVEQMPRDESVCQYTIVEDEYFEVKDLSADSRFKDRSYVAKEPNLRYYFGIPLKTETGHNIGALCVLDVTKRELTPEKVDLLKMIAREIVNRLKVLKLVDDLRTQATDAHTTKIKVVHDIRGPLSGIIGLAQFISEQGDKNKLEDVLQLITMIYKSGNSLLELAEEILAEEKKSNQPEKVENAFNLNIFKEKLVKLYQPQTLNKGVGFNVSIDPEDGLSPISKNKLLQITGNLISNAIKFTPAGGTVEVKLLVEPASKGTVLHISVSDTGIGIDAETADCILSGNADSTSGTCGERGFGFGLSLVKHLVDNLKGTMEITSAPGEGTTFHIALPQN